MIKIGITGGIGSGKSVVASLLALSGVPVYIADEESKKIQSKDGLQISFEKHKIFLYKEDFEKFMEGMQDVISYIKNSNLKKSAEDVVEPEEEETIHGDSPEEDMASGAIKLDIEF